MDLMDELIDRYGDPPKAIQGLVTVALVRNMASNLGITEITQRNGAMIFYIKTISLEQLGELNGTFINRVTFNSFDKPYLAVKMLKTDKPVELMEKVIDLLYKAVNKTAEN